MPLSTEYTSEIFGVILHKKNDLFYFCDLESFNDDNLLDNGNKNIISDELDWKLYPFEEYKK